MLDISEIFYSIQGESTFSGLPCIFIRLAGCNLRCRYCDSAYSYEEQGTRKSADDILKEISSTPCSLVEITGGEPLLQRNVYQLFNLLLDKHYTVLLETNGSVSLKQVPAAVHIIMDIKSPGSSMQHHFLEENLDILARRAETSGTYDEVKLVITSRDDYEWARDMVVKHSLDRFSSVLISPVSQLFSASQTAEMILRDNLPARLQLQLHTIVWPEAERGK